MRSKKGKGKKVNNSPIKVKDLSTENETSTNCLHSNSNVSEASRIEEDFQGVHQTSTTTSSLHSNPRVVEAARIFEEGELKHDVAQCRICNEIRPVFYKTTHVEPKLNDNDMYFPKSWSVGNDGKCNRCRQEEIDNKKRKNPTSAPKFSGIFSRMESECGVNFLHNNMHFEEIPPYAKPEST